MAFRVHRGVIPEVALHHASTLEGRSSGLMRDVVNRTIPLRDPGDSRCAVDLGDLGAAVHANCDEAGETK